MDATSNIVTSRTSSERHCALASLSGIPGFGAKLFMFSQSEKRQKFWSETGMGKFCFRDMDRKILHVEAEGFSWEVEQEGTTVLNIDRQML